VHSLPLRRDAPVAGGADVEGRAGAIVSGRRVTPSITIIRLGVVIML
jgi:hypothetical protein